MDLLKGLDKGHSTNEGKEANEEEEKPATGGNRTHYLGIKGVCSTAVLQL